MAPAFIATKLGLSVGAVGIVSFHRIAAGQIGVEHNRIGSATHRLVMSHFPPIDLFDDIADPRDWESLAVAQSRTNPQIYEEIGDPSLVPVDRRLSGEGASWVMAAFTHISPDRSSRFSDGSFGVYYAGDSLETALREHTFHISRFFRDTAMEPGWISEVRQLIGTVDTELVDLRQLGFDHLLDPDIATYPVSQAFAVDQKAQGRDGIVYPSLRHDGGQSPYSIRTQSRRRCRQTIFDIIGTANALTMSASCRATGPFLNWSDFEACHEG